MENIDLHENINNELKYNDPNKKYADKTFYSNEEKNNFYYNYQVSSPSPSSLSILKVYPLYSRNRKIGLDDIHLEYINKLYHGVEANEKIGNNNKIIKDNHDLINSEFLLVNNYLKSILETLQISVEEYLQYLVDYSKKVNNIIFPILYTIFILTIIISLFGIIISFIYIFADYKKIYYYTLQFVWNFILFLSLLGVMCEITFKIFEIFGEDGAGLLQYATSEKNLDSSDSIIFKGAGKLFLKMCFNNENNGDLLSKILQNINHNSSSSIISKIKIIHQSETFVKEYYYNQVDQTELDHTKKLCQNLEDMSKDYSLISYLDIIIKNPQEVFDDLNLYTDYSNPLISHQSLSSNKHSYDVWTTREENCHSKYEGYKYINNALNRTDDEGKKYCMVLDEFDKNIAQNFYSGINCVLSKDVDGHFSDFYDSLNTFSEENRVYLTENPNFIGITKNYYEELITIKELILKGLYYCKNILDLIGVLLHISSEDSSSIDLFSLMNCQFLQRDSKVFYVMMEKLRNNSRYCLYLSIFVFVFMLINSILAICNIYKYKKCKEPASDRESSNNILLN